MKYYPPEWQEHKSTWFSFPHNLDEWNAARLETIQDWFISLYDLILDYEDIDLIFTNQALLGKSESKLQLLKSKKFELRTHVIPNNDIWIRDYGPFFMKSLSEKSHLLRYARPYLRNSKLRDSQVLHLETFQIGSGNDDETEILDFGFNAWGEKFPPWSLDNEVPKALSEKFSYPSQEFKMIMEGGSLEFNGDGIIMTSEQCLLNKNRNPSMSKSEIENELKNAFEIKEVLWLKEGLEGDHTDGHIDDFARFIDANTVMLCQAEASDVNYQRLVENRKVLEKRGLKIIDLPLPKVMTMDGERLPNSYANFIFLNGAVLVPIFNCKQDERALEIFRKTFSSRKVLSIDSTLLIEEGGGLHCASKQEPR